jgi:signal peptidase I
MVFRRAFQLSEQTLKDLKETGIRPAVLSALQAKMRGSVYGQEEFHQVLAGLGPSPTPEEADAILKYCRLSLLRLERIIPNRGLREWLDAAVFALVIALLVRTFLFAPFKIPSSSMVPTIQVGDHIFATMFSYGIPVPFTDIKLFPQPIERDDIVIFPYPGDPSVDYIKRVIAVGGDTVEIEGTVVKVNGKASEVPFAHYDGAAECGQFCAVQTVPPGHLLVMGDNRSNSMDSRFWGYVDERTVKGKGRIVYWSHDPNEGLFSLSGYRFGRIGHLLR